MSDSTLGFRHGPKTILNDRTLVVVLLSNDGYARAYDCDLLRGAGARGPRRRPARARRARGWHWPCRQAHHPGHGTTHRHLELAPLLVLVAQSFALLQSLALGLTPDRPDPAGTVNRVVQGVTIHPWNGAGVHVPRR